MYTNEPKLKDFVERFNKRNREIEARKNQDKIIIKYTIEKEINKDATTKPKRNTGNRRTSRRTTSKRS